MHSVEVEEEQLSWNLQAYWVSSILDAEHLPVSQCGPPLTAPNHFKWKQAFLFYLCVSQS